MDENNPEFLAYCARVGYVPWRPFVHQRERFFRHWLAWQAGIPPYCTQADHLLQLSGLK